MATGKLIVFEGPDGVGKTTLAKGLVSLLKQKDDNTTYFAFPGRQAHTLGELVYRLHHDPNSIVGGPVTPTALQALHIAAHIDAIEQIIVPALMSGITVILDRYWWSTYVYGQTQGADIRVIDALIEAEKCAWGKIKPEIIFLIDAEAPRRSISMTAEKWNELRDWYERMNSSSHISTIDNSSRPVEMVLQEILEGLDS